MVGKKPQRKYSAEVLEAKRKLMRENNPARLEHNRKRMRENNPMYNEEIKRKSVEKRKDSKKYSESHKIVRPPITIQGKYIPLELPKGYVTHHIDFNQNNNEDENRIGIPLKMHIKLHSKMNKFIGLIMDNGYVPKSLET